MLQQYWPVFSNGDEYDFRDGFINQLVLQHFDADRVVNTYPLNPHFAEHPLPAAQLVIPFSLNETDDADRFLEQVNAALEYEGQVIGFAETAELYKRHILGDRPSFLQRMKYFFKFCIHRAFPKLSVSAHNLYRSMAKNKKRWYTQPEILGRLFRSRLAVKDWYEEDGLFYFVAQKSGVPDLQSQPSYWPVFKMRRMGKNGKIIGVYKFRTMHPYAEYLQEYIKNKHGLDVGGKFRNDFRVSSWGKWMRKYWIDELPMFINLLKGDIKLVGVRPISVQYFSMYTDELKQIRVKHKPGLIPPYYADMPKTLQEVMDSEKKYLLQYEKNPFTTDCHYLCKILANIFIRRARSK